MRRTTVRLDDELLAEAKALAAKQRRSLNSVMEDALRLMLHRQERATDRARVELPVFSGDVGYQKWVDPSVDIKHIADELDVQDYLEAMNADEAH